jgi:hypothetical protein
MKTEILTSELLKIINPTKDEINYKEQKVKLDFKELKKYIEDPKTNNVFAITGDLENDLYKNLALYIINAGNEPNLITLDLNSPTIFESGKGLFEYIKNVYNNDEKSYISLPESGDNLLLIQSNNLSQLSDELDIQDAEDMHYATAASAFSTNPSLTKKTRGQVTWQHLNSDMYGDLNYVVGKVEEVFDTRRKSGYGNDESNEKLFENLFEKINPELSYSDEFKLALMDLNSKILNEFFIERYNENDHSVYLIDYSQPIFQAKLLEQVKDGQFTLVGQLFDSFLTHKNNYHNDESPKISKRLKETIDFETLFNQPETIEYLLRQHYDNDGFSKHAATEFTLASVYPLLDKEKRLDEAIVKKCLALACKKNSNGYMSIREEIIFNLEPQLFNNEYVLTPLMGHIDAPKIKRFLDYRGDFPILKDREFLMSTTKNMYGWKLAEWLDTFFTQEELNKEFIKDLVRNNKNFLETINQQKYYKFNDFSYEPEITIAALEGGLTPNNIGDKAMRPLLFIDHNEQIERAKLIYLIENRAIGDFSYELRVKGEELQHLQNKYNKPEFLFYQKDDWSIRNLEARQRVASKLKNREEVFNVFEKVAQHNLKYKFLSGLFYESLPTHLQKNKKIVYKLLELGTLPYNKLVPTIAYNSDIALKCLSKRKEDIKDIPAEMFTNAKFALGFAKLMDRSHFKDADIPPFVTKFFENQEVTNKYEEKLKEHLFYTDLQADLDKPGEVKKTKKAKL